MTFRSLTRPQILQRPAIGLCLLLNFILISGLCQQGYAQQQPDTLIVKAEGLADPNSIVYQKDKGLMIDDLRRDAQRQAIEKAVSVYVESETLVENYILIEDKVLSRSKGLIKQIIEQGSPQLGEDGFMHMQITAEVFISDVKTAIDALSEQSRIGLIRKRGNPTISVAVVVRDAQRGEDIKPENSPIAENILKEHFVDFGYRVWSENYTQLLRKEAGARSGSRRVADFSVIGEVKFKKTSMTLKASGLTINKHALTSWTVKGMNNHTGEEIYFNNKIPKNKAWSSEDEALEDIGRLIGQEFSKDFFESQLLNPSQMYEIQLTGLPDYDTALLFKDEFIGLRNILNADLINFDTTGISQFEVECTTGGANFMQMLNNAIIKPLNAKLDGPSLKLTSFHGNVVSITLDPGNRPDQINQALRTSPPASLASASPERINKLVQDEQLRRKVGHMNPTVQM